MKLPWEKSESASDDEWAGYEGGIRVLRAVPREDTVVCVKRLVTAAFAHRRKRLANSLELAGFATRGRATEALRTIGRDPATRAEELAPPEFVALAEALPA